MNKKLQLEQNRELAYNLLFKAIANGSIDGKSGPSFHKKLKNNPRQVTLDRYLPELYQAAYLGKHISVASVIRDTKKDNKQQKIISQLDYLDKKSNKKQLKLKDIELLNKNAKKSQIKMNKQIKKLGKSEKRLVSIEYTIWVTDETISKNNKKRTILVPVPTDDLLPSGKIVKKNTTVKMRLASEGTISVEKYKLLGYKKDTPYIVPSENQMGQRLLNLIDDSNNNNSYFYAWLVSRLGAIIINDIDELGTPKPYDPINNLLARDSAPKVNFKYIEYTPNYDAEHLKELMGDIQLNKYLADNYKKDSCVYTTLLDAYRESFIKAKQAGRYVDIELTYEYLWKLIHPNEQYNKENAMIDTIQNMTEFFKKYSLKIVALDINYKVVYKFVPKSINKHINPRVLYLLVHNNHCYRLNSNLKRLEQMEEPKEDKIQESLKHFIFSKPIEVFSFINNINEINTLEFTESLVKVYYNDNIKELLKYLLFKIKYEPVITMNAGQIAGIKIKIGKTDVIITNPGANYDNMSIHFKNGEYLLKYSQYEAEMYDILINKNNISNYHPDLIKTFYKYPRTAFIGAFVDQEDFIECNSYDYNKAYTSILLDIQYFPTFNSFDNFVPYKNEEIKDYSFYIVERLETKLLSEYLKNSFLILLDKKYNIVTGYVIKRSPILKHSKIHFVATPSKLVKNSSSRVIKKIYESDLEIEHKKFIVNKLLGTAEKKYRSKQKSKIYYDYNEACHYKNKKSKIVTLSYVDKVVEQPMDEDMKILDPSVPDTEIVTIQGKEKAYILVETEQEYLTEGFYPIKCIIYDIMRLKMFDLYNKLHFKGAKIYGINTDSLFVNKDFIYKIPQRDNNVYDSIGKIRFEENKLCPPSMKRVFNNELDVDYEKEIEQTPINIIDEWDQSEFNKIFAENTKLIVKAEIPGAGKTSCLRKYADSIGKDKVLFVAPYNTLCLDFKLAGYESSTLHELLNIRINDDNNECNTKANFNYEKYTVIVFDEIYCYDVKHLARINQFMNSNEEIKFFATGDPYQNRPIQDLTVANFKNYYDNIITKLFQNVVTLKICKRVKTDKERKILQNLKNDILFGEKFDAVEIAKKYFKIVDDISKCKGTMITYRNETAEILNTYFHDRKKAPTKYVQFQNIKYYVGLTLRCRKYIKKGQDKAFVNYQYIITRINKNEFTIKEIHSDKTITLNIEELTKFTLHYSGTCHSLQGVTVNDSVTIFDLNFVMVSREWLYTAVTRCNNLDNIYVCLTENMKQNKYIVRSAIKRKINAHKIEDNKKEREYDDNDFVDIHFVCSKFDAQNGRCARCLNEIILDYKPKDECQFSINRIDNRLAHIKSNCELTCLKCQHSYKQNIQMKK